MNKTTLENLEKTIPTSVNQNIIQLINEILDNFYTSKEWMSISEATKYIGVSPNTFNKFRLLGLKVCEIDGIKRVSKKEIDRFLTEHSF